LTVPNLIVEDVIQPFIYLDLDYLKDMGKGNVDYERKITNHFIYRIPEDMQTLQTALKAGNYEQIKKTAHSLRTTLAIMGVLQKTVHMLDDLEFSGDQRNFGQLICGLEVICNEAIKEAQVYLKSLQNR